MIHRMILAILAPLSAPAWAAPVEVTEDARRIRVVGPALDASIRKEGYVSGVEGGSLLDKETGSRDLGFGLDIVDWLMEPGSDEAYREKLPGDLPYLFNNLVHGRRPKRSIEGPQVCTRAGKLAPRIIKGRDFVAVQQGFTYQIAAPGKARGSRWEQTIVFPEGERYFVSTDRVTTANASDALFLRLDMPGHIKHKDGDTFSEVYLSYHGTVEAGEFVRDFAPDAKYLYVREAGKVPRRFIRTYHLRDPKTGKDGPWLTGMTLDPSVVSEAWCHQRGYVCLIEEVGGRPIRAGESFGAAYIVGFFDSIAEMERVYDQYAGHDAIEVDDRGWRLVSRPDGSRHEAFSEARQPRPSGAAGCWPIRRASRHRRGVPGPSALRPSRPSRSAESSSRRMRLGRGVGVRGSSGRARRGSSRRSRRASPSRRTSDCALASDDQPRRSPTASSSAARKPSRARSARGRPEAAVAQVEADRGEVEAVVGSSSRLSRQPRVQARGLLEKGRRASRRPRR